MRSQAVLSALFGAVVAWDIRADFSSRFLEDFLFKLAHDADPTL